jgi:hypothetical protein
VQKEGPSGKKEHIAWLKGKHSLGHGQAQVVVQRMESGGAGNSSYASLCAGKRMRQGECDEGAALE